MVGIAVVVAVRVAVAVVVVVAVTVVVAVVVEVMVMAAVAVGIADGVVVGVSVSVPVAVEEMSASERRKGHDWERDVVHAFKRAMPSRAVQRMAPLQGNKDAEQPDVIAHKFWIECKVGKRPNILRALDQVARTANANRGCVPIAAVKIDHRSPTVTLHMDDFLKLMMELEHLRQL